MKRKRLIIGLSITFGVIAVLALFIYIILSMLTSFNPVVIRKMLNYYNDDGNYLEFTGNFVYVSELDKENGLWVRFKSDDEEFNVFIKNRGSAFDDNSLSFKVVEENLNVLIESEFDFDSDKRYKIKSAPVVFDLSILFPIVSITSEDGSVVYLDFKTGKANWLNYIKSLN